MHERSKTFIDKTRWPAGPWQNEPDKVQWIDDATLLTCLVVRHHSLGHWCGYVGVADVHPLFRVDYEQFADDAPSAHGGIMFTHFCQEGDGKEHGICHTAEPGFPERVWWIGFDCGHAGDISPGVRGLNLATHRYGTYKPLAFVREQCAKLARSLVQLETAKVQTVR